MSLTVVYLLRKFANSGVCTVRRAHPRWALERAVSQRPTVPLVSISTCAGCFCCGRNPQTLSRTRGILIAGWFIKSPQNMMILGCTYSRKPTFASESTSKTSKHFVFLCIISPSNFNRIQFSTQSSRVLDDTTWQITPSALAVQSQVATCRSETAVASGATHVMPQHERWFRNDWQPPC